LCVLLLVVLCVLLSSYVYLLYEDKKAEY
jgi:hypothetical protein